MYRAATPAHRLRAPLPGGGPDAARLPLRGALAALRPQAPGRPVSLPASAVRIQQAATRRAAPGQAHDPGAGDRQRLLVRQPLDHRLDSGAVRNVASDRAAIQPGRLGRLWILGLSLSVLLGPA